MQICAVIKKHSNLIVNGTYMAQNNRYKSGISGYIYVCDEFLCVIKNCFAMLT